MQKVDLGDSTHINHEKQLLQLTSFFSGSEARMQNISAGIGYRLDPKNRLVTFLKDLEFSYALSYLALPENVGTHMLVITKYF